MNRPKIADIVREVDTVLGNKPQPPRESTFNRRDQMVAPVHAPPSPVPLSLARRSVVHGAGAPPADVPLQGAATWDPRNGLRTWEALDVAARHVVACERVMPMDDPDNRPRIIAVGRSVNPRKVVNGKRGMSVLAGLSMAEERALLDAARASLDVR